jgi:large subunit ribosomal protein L20
MGRVTSGLVSHRKAKKVLKAAKGYVGGHSKLYKTAKEAQMRALAFAYRDRKQKKRQFRRLWITRLNAAVQEYGFKYNQFIHQMSKTGIIINRKVLSNLAVFNKNAFKKVIEKIKNNA